MSICTQAVLLRSATLLFFERRNEMRRYQFFLFAIVFVLIISPSAFADMIEVWGNDNYGMVSNAPLGNDFVDILTAYWGHGLAQKADDSLVSWGRSGGYAVPAGNDFIDIAAGRYFGVAIKSNGSLVGWANAGDGQLHFSRMGVQVRSGGNPVNASLTDENRFLTLVVTDDGNGYDWGMFAEPALELASTKGSKDQPTR
jgi:hypothetical protein